MKPKKEASSRCTASRYGAPTGVAVEPTAVEESPSLPLALRRLATLHAEQSDTSDVLERLERIVRVAEHDLFGPAPPSPDKGTPEETKSPSRGLVRDIVDLLDERLTDQVHNKTHLVLLVNSLERLFERVGVTFVDGNKAAV